MKMKLTNLTATLKRNLKNNRWWQDDSDFNLDKSKPTIQFTPGIINITEGSGYHYIQYKNTTIWII